jgi:glucokinase
MAEKKDLAIGLDLGGTKILAALVTEKGEIIHKVETETLAEGGQEKVYQRVLLSIQRLLDKSEPEKSRIKGIGIAAAGVIDSQKKEVIFANNLGWKNIPIGPLLEKEFDLPTQLNNDANAAAVSEKMWGAGKGKENLVYITVSTGVGAGMISNGQLITGIGHCAGEFGHISIDVNGPFCECGNRGCLENYTSGTAIARIARERLEKGEKSSYFCREREYSEISAEEVGIAAKQGDSFAVNLLNEVGTYLGAGIITLIHLLNTEVIILGGGVMNLSEILLPVIRKTVKERGIPEMARRLEVEKSVLGKNAGVLGAAGCFLSEEIEIFEKAAEEGKTDFTYSLTRGCD